MPAISRDAGLIRAMGPWALAASTINFIVGASIFAIPAALAMALGPFAPLAFFVCALAVGSVAICLAEGGTRVPTSGGIYGYVDTAFGPLTGYVAGTLVWFGNALSNGAIAAAFADVLMKALSLQSNPQSTVARVAIIVMVIGGFALVNVRGVKGGVRTVNVITAAKLIPLMVFVLVGVFAFHQENFQQSFAFSTANMGRALLLALFSLTGMEGSLCASGEVRNPTKTIPRGLAIAIAGAALLYVGVQTAAQGILGAALPHSSVPLADAMARVNPLLRFLMLGGAGLSMFGFLAGDMLSTPRMLFAFGHDGTLPGALGRLHPLSHAPHIAIWSYAALAMALALSGTFAELAVLASLTSAALYIGGCAAAFVLARRGIALAGTPLNFRWLRSSMVIGVVSMLALIAMASRAEILGLLALMAISAAVYWLIARFALSRRTAISS